MVDNSFKDLDAIRQEYRDRLSEKTRKQILYLIENPETYAVLMSLNESDNKEGDTVEEIYLRAIEYVPDKTLDILKFAEALNYIEEEDLADFKYS